MIGNTLVILVVSTNHQMRNTTNALILNLALADLLFIIFCVPFTATDYSLDRWPFGLVWCQVDLQKKQKRNAKECNSDVLHRPSST